MSASGHHRLPFQEESTRMKVRELVDLLSEANPEASVLFDDENDLYEPALIIENDIENSEGAVFIFRGRQA